MLKFSVSMALLAPFRDQVLMHIDLHETIDTGETEVGRNAAQATAVCAAIDFSLSC